MVHERFEILCDEGKTKRGFFWGLEPGVGRVADGIPKRVDRLRGLGNAIVPQIAFEIINTMVECSHQKPGEF